MRVSVGDRANAAGVHDAQPYVLYAIKYAHHVSRKSLIFLGGDANDGPMAFDYFVWLAVGNGRKVLIDTGFKKVVADRRGRSWIHCPSEAVKLVGISAGDITDVVVTHLHFDHAGNLDKFPNAIFHIQDEEMKLATGRQMCICHPTLVISFEVEDVVNMVRHLFARRLVFHNGDDELCPGIRLLHMPGHTPGMQVAEVRTARGPVLLISDASHFYANMNEGRPFFMYHCIEDVFASYRRIRSLALSPDHIIPGHDPLVMTQYPAPGPDMEGHVVRLDVPPRFRAVSEATTY
jgi:glyoxylase-like metal-dependent hydrolase (beta-lactamase superfamily II)